MVRERKADKRRKLTLMIFPHVAAYLSKFHDLFNDLPIKFVADVGTNFQEDAFTITCPAGCIEDPSRGTVYGSKVFTEVSSSSLP